MTNAAAKKRTWTGCACPICRFVFRVPKGCQDEGVICPACHYLLCLPDLENTLAVDLSHQRKTQCAKVRAQQSQMAAFSKAGERRLDDVPNRKKRSNSESPSWDTYTSTQSASEQSASHQLVGRGEGSKLWGVAGVVLVGCVLGAVVWLMGGDGDDHGDDGRKVILDRQMMVEVTPPSKGESSNVEKKIELNQQESEEVAVHVLEDSKEVVRTFLLAETLDVLGGVVRTPEITKPRMKRWYKTHELKAHEVKQIGIDGSLVVKGRLAVMNVRFKDYSVRTIAVERGADGYLVDWESWVAWGEMDWKDLFKKRPTQLVELRVIISKDSYYNRQFKDEQKWLAVRLEHPHADRTIYGYIDIQAPQLMRLRRDLKSAQSIRAIVKVRYPESAVADNQVMIEEYVQSGWVVSPEALLKESAIKNSTLPSNLSNK